MYLLTSTFWGICVQAKANPNSISCLPPSLQIYVLDISLILSHACTLKQLAYTKNRSFLQYTGSIIRRFDGAGATPFPFSYEGGNAGTGGDLDGVSDSNYMSLNISESSSTRLRRLLPCRQIHIDCFEA